MKLDELGRSLWQRIGGAEKYAFFAALIGGYVTHVYAFTNIIPNADGLSRVYDLQQMTVSGRWFLHYATSLNGFTQMPAVIGFLSLVLLGLAAGFAVNALDIKSRGIGALCGALMAVFPSVGFTFMYMFTASAYCLAIFMAVLSVWMALRGRLGFLVGVVLVALTMGTYQVYVTIAIALSVLCVIRRVLEPENSFLSCLQQGVKLMAYLALGAVLYYVILQVFLKVKDLELLSYLGMDAASSGYPFSQLPSLVVDTYKQVVKFFFVPGSPNGFATDWFAVLNLIAFGFGVLFMVTRLTGEKLWQTVWRWGTVLVLLAIFPLAINFGQIISPYSAPTPLMKYSFVMVYLAVLMLADLADVTAWPKRLHGGAMSVAVVWCALLLLFCLNTNNLMYTASAQAHRAAESYFTRLMARVETCEGYEEGMEVLFIGAIPDGQIQSAVESYRQVDHYSVPVNNVAHLNKHIYYYLNDWLSIPVEEPAEDTLIAAAESEAFMEMSLYPAADSVRVVDGSVIVKLRDTYTPKSDFEIAYENRR